MKLHQLELTQNQDLQTGNEILLNGTDSSGTNEGDKVILDGTDGSSTDAGSSILQETGGSYTSVTAAYESQLWWCR